MKFSIWGQIISNLEFCMNLSIRWESRRCFQTWEIKIIYCPFSESYWRVFETKTSKLNHKKGWGGSAESWKQKIQHKREAKVIGRIRMKGKSQKDKHSGGLNREWVVQVKGTRTSTQTFQNKIITEVTDNLFKYTRKDVYLCWGIWGCFYWKLSKWKNKNEV